MKLYFLLILLLTGAASGDNTKRILAGVECNSMKYHVEVESVLGGGRCGGALLNTQWIVTASHCAEKSGSIRVTLGENDGRSVFSKGFKSLKNFFTGKSNPLVQEIPIENRFNFKDEEGNSHDIVLVKLKEAVSGKLPVVTLPSECSKPEPGSKLEIGGTGSTKAGQKTKKPLRCATTTVKECKETDKPSQLYLSSHTMCAFTPGVEVCFGDSGSPVEYSGVFHGIVISDPQDKCTNPIVILDICQYTKWIEETMENNSKN